MIPKSKLLLVTGLVLLWSFRCASQTLSAPPPVSDLNVEILNLNPAPYVGSVPDQGVHGGFYANGRLRRIAGWIPTAEVPSAVSVIKVEFWLEQGAVRIEVHAFVGQIAPGSRPPDWEKLQKIKLASHLAREDETVNIDETERVGIETFQVRITRADPWSIGPPEIVNKTQALHVEATTENRPAYFVAVRNVSTRNITAIQWYGVANGRRLGGSGQRSAQLIPAGKMFRLSQRFAPADGLQKADLSAPRQIVIAAILFDDGSFEGEPDTAAAMAAQWTGESLQLSRLIQLLKSVAANADTDQTSRLSRLKADITALDTNVDSAAATKLLTRFPGVSDDMRQRRITIELKAGLMYAKDNLLHEIQRFEFQEAHAAPGKDLSTWLTEMIAKYEKVRAPYL